MTWSDRRIAILLAAAGAAVYLVAGLGLLTDYDYYGRLAQALLQERSWLSEAPPWLNELVPCGAERWCVVYPPLPAILAIPFAALLPMVKDEAWFFDTELLILAQRAGMRVHEVPVDWTDDPDSRVAIMRTAMEDLRGVVRLRFGPRPKG